MDEAFIYRQIADKIRQEILSGALKPGDRLPSVRAMAETWNCTIGTIQRAYQELSRQGLVTSRAGQGTRVVDRLPASLQADVPLRHAALVHRAEAFLLESLSAGYPLSEIETAFHQALDRWRVSEQKSAPGQAGVLRFTGSHDPVVTWLAGEFPNLASGYVLELQFAGSLGGLMALAQGQCDLTGIHLWDEESQTYNLPFVRRLFPNQLMALVNLTHRRLGFILPPGNPANIQTFADLTRRRLRLAIRQPGSGTRVWLDAMLARQGIPTGKLESNWIEKMTHTEVARAVAENEADVGIGVEAAALSFELDFIMQTLERYDLVMTEKTLKSKPIHLLLEALQEPRNRRVIQNMGGYETSDSGKVAWTL